MRFRIRHVDRIVGLFILLALALVVAMLIFIAVNQRWFSHNAFYKSKLISTNGLAVGSALTMRGFELGKISHMALTDDNLVEIDFYVYEQYINKVTQDSVIEMVSSPIGLPPSLVFHKGKSNQPLAPGSLVPSLDMPEGLALDREGKVDRPKKDDSITSLLASINEMAVLINDTLKGRGSGPLNDTLLSIKKGAASFPLTMSDIQQAVAKVNGNLDSLPSILKEVDTNLANLQSLTEKLRDPTGLVPTLLGTKNLSNQIDQTMLQLNKSMEDLNRITAGIAGEVPKLSSLLMEVRGAISSAEDVMEGLKNNPLLKDGITKKPTQQAVFESMRREDF